VDIYEHCHPSNVGKHLKFMKVSICSVFVPQVIGQVFALLCGKLPIIVIIVI
jgi:hypothetical protein